MLSKEGLDLILEFEVGGADGAYYNKFLKKPTVPAWQTTKSGVTIGVGTDMGYQSQLNVDEEWSEYLKPAEIKKLYSVLGLKGADATTILIRSRVLKFHGKPPRVNLTSLLSRAILGWLNLLFQTLTLRLFLFRKDLLVWFLIAETLLKERPAAKCAKLSLSCLRNNGMEFLSKLDQ
jgi:hypothetical protein